MTNEAISNLVRQIMRCEKLAAHYRRKAAELKNELAKAKGGEAVGKKD